MNDTKICFFQENNLFDALTDRAKSFLAEKAKVKMVNKNRIIYFPDELSDTFFILKKGKVKIYSISNEGKELILGILQEGEIFGELALFDQEPRGHYAIATEDAVICAMDIEDMNEWMVDNPNFILRISKKIGSRMKFYQSRLESLTFKSAQERIVEFIKRMVDENGRDVGDEKEVKLGLTHQEIANITATSRQTVTSVLNDLERQKIILYDRKRILVRNYKLLAS